MIFLLDVQKFEYIITNVKIMMVYNMLAIMANSKGYTKTKKLLFEH